MPREVVEKKGTPKKDFNLAPLTFPLAGRSCYVRLCMCCVPLAGVGEEWVRVVVRKGKKRKGEAVSGDTKRKGKERGVGLLPGHPAADDGEGSGSAAADGGSECA